MPVSLCRAWRSVCSECVAQWACVRGHRVVCRDRRHPNAGRPVALRRAAGATPADPDSAPPVTPTGAFRSRTAAPPDKALQTLPCLLCFRLTVASHTVVCSTCLRSCLCSEGVCRSCVLTTAECHGRVGGLLWGHAAVLRLRPGLPARRLLPRAGTHATVPSAPHIPVWPTSRLALLRDPSHCCGPNLSDCSAHLLWAVRLHAEPVALPAF